MATSKDVASLLIEYGANVFAERHDGTTVLDWAQDKNRTEILELLSSMGFDVVDRTQSATDRTKSFIEDYITGGDERKKHIQTLKSQPKRVQKSKPEPESATNDKVQSSSRFTEPESETTSSTPQAPGTGGDTGKGTENDKEKTTKTGGCTVS